MEPIVKIDEGKKNFNDISLNQFRNLATDGFCKLDLKNGLIFSLKAPKSDQEDVTYLRLDQPYELKMSYWLPITEAYKQQPVDVSSIVSVQFCTFGDKSLQDVTNSWESWASSHPNESLRILEIDGKHSDNVTIDSRLALNAMKVVWKPGIDAPIMNITIKCLSFTPEETTEGLPLLLQIDSYLENQLLNESGVVGPKLVNRGYCHLKTIKNSRMTRGSLQRPDPWTKEFGISKNGNDLTKISKVTIFYVDEGYLPHPIFFMVRYVKNLKTKEELKEFENIKEQVEKIEAKEQVEDMETNEQEEKIITENQKRIDGN